MYKKGLLRYAIDSQNNFVSVDKVAKGLACNCFCPSCRERLIAKNGGTKRIHHFAHASGVDCDSAYETMLHILAKIKIQEAFLNQEEFKIQFEHRAYCPNAKSCGFVKYDDCFTSTIKVFNLKNFYDSCEQEVQYDTISRRSDLKIFSSKNSNIPPIYIEFCVTHASDEFKLHNGGKIIEVKITCEEDIDRIVETGFVETSVQNRTISFDCISSGVLNTTFLGFKSEDYNEMDICQEIEFSRYILYASGKSQCYQDVSNCKKLSKAHKHSLLEICFHTPVAFGIYEMAKYQGYLKFGIKNCLYCTNFIDNYNGIGKFCRLYKNIGIDRLEQHDSARAKDCKHFILNNEEMTAEIEHFKSLQPNEYTILNE
ncbi:MAG: hypothetical protein NC241_07660 [Bacteroides sp.]|nr:hypothetical protein [Bacteroides sp.]MCM1456454.1 hypothetical protein [Lachnoclostridium sp.]